MVNLRPLILADIPILSSMLSGMDLWQGYGMSEGRLAKDLERSLKRSDMVLIAEAKRGKEPVGIVWCQAGAAFGRSGFVKLIAVGDKHRRKGVASKLLAEAEGFIADISFDIFLHVSDFNKDARAFFKRHAYEQVGILKDYVIPDVDEHIYRKRLE